MSAVDYQQTAEDHQSLLILVRHTGSHLPTSLFNRVWEQIHALDVVHVQGQNRNVIVRYKRSYPIENNEWGDFQAHRKVLGLISVGKCVDHEEFGDLFENYKKVKEEYASTIINSRLIIYGMNTDGSPIEPAQQNNGSTSPSSSHLSSLSHISQHSSMIDSGHETTADGSKSSVSVWSSLSDPSGASTAAADDHEYLSTTSTTIGVGSSVVEMSNSGAGGDRGTNSSCLRDITVSDASEKEGYDKEGGVDCSVSKETRERSGSEACSVTINFGKSATASGQRSGGGGEGSTGKSKDIKGSDKEEEEHIQLERGRPHSNSLTKGSKGSEVVFYPNLEHCADLEERLKEFVTSLFYVLEGKRLERTFERSDRMVLLYAPFEKKDYIGVDTETKSFKRRCMGRLRKHLGDLCLQAGLPGEAILHYQTALDMLRTVNDFLWMGGCYEGLCSASVVLTMAHTKPAAPLRRNQSFSVKRGLSSPEISQKGNTAAQFRQQNSLGSYSNGLDNLDQSASQLHCLNPDDIIEKYKEALHHYSKYKNSAMIEIEASMKACRVLIYQSKYLQASDFLQNCVYINLASSEEDKIQRYSTLSTLYGQIGFRRKEAFFKRVAAMQCVTGSNPAWQHCYSLLLQAVEAYSIGLDPRNRLRDVASGWPVIQHRVLHELVYSARRMGSLQLAVRHSTLMLHTLYPHLKPEEQKEVILGLELLTSRCPGTTQPLSTESGIFLPPVHLTTLPTVKSFKVLSPPAHLKPEKVNSTDSPTGIFIYTPLSYGTDERNGNSPDLDFQLVAEDLCEVQLQVINPLSVELRMLYMGLLTEGVEVEVFPASPFIAPSHSPLTVKLLARPRLPGQLTILGYDTQVFGVRSHCRLRDIGTGVPPLYNVEVVPALPQVSLECSLPKASVFASSSLPEGATVVANVSALLYAGQSHDCVVTLKNISAYPVTSLSLRLDSRNDAKEVTDKMFQWSAENICSQLPLQPGAQLCIALCLYAHSDFLLPPVASPDMASSSISSRSHNENEKGTQTVEALLCVEYTGGPGQEAGYCRRCSLAVTVDVLPCLYITNWNTMPVSSGQEVTLVLDLLNVSNHVVDVQCHNTFADPSLPLSIQPQQCRRVGVMIPRVSFPQQTLLDKFECRVPAKYRTWRTPDFHSQFLSTYVDIRWNMSTEMLNGKVSIDYLKWSEDHLNALLQPDITWEVTVNGQHYTAPGLMNFSLSEIVTVHVNLYAAKEYHQLVTVSVEPTGGTGQFECHNPLDSDTYLCLGSPAASVSMLRPDENFDHSCSFLFLALGSYQLRISCSTCQSSWICLPSPQFCVTSDACSQA